MDQYSKHYQPGHQNHSSTQNKLKEMKPMSPAKNKVQIKKINGVKSLKLQNGVQSQ